jgi:hypothetical protein
MEIIYIDTSAALFDVLATVSDFISASEGADGIGSIHL